MSLMYINGRQDTFKFERNLGERIKNTTILNCTYANIY